jgi:hypothetical protein
VWATKPKGLNRIANNLLRSYIPEGREPHLSWILVAQSLVFYVTFCGWSFIYLLLLFWPRYSLSFSDKQFIITPVVTASALLWKPQAFYQDLYQPHVLYCCINWVLHVYTQYKFTAININGKFTMWTYKLILCRNVSLLSPNNFTTEKSNLISI